MAKTIAYQLHFARRSGPHRRGSQYNALSLTPLALDDCGPESEPTSIEIRPKYPIDIGSHEDGAVVAVIHGMGCRAEYNDRHKRVSFVTADGDVELRCHAYPVTADGQ